MYTITNQVNEKSRLSKKLEKNIPYIFISPNDLEKTIKVLDERVPELFKSEGALSHRVFLDDNTYVIGLSSAHSFHGFDDKSISRSLTEAGIIHMSEKFTGNFNCLKSRLLNISQTVTCGYEDEFYHSPHN